MTPGATKTPPSATEFAKAMPFDNPTFQVAPVVFGARHGLTVVGTTDTGFINRLLPPPLVAVGSDLILQFNFNTITSPVDVSYHNATVIVPAKLYGRGGLYFARIYEGSRQAAMLSIWGREIWGFPKVAADVSVARDTAAATATMIAANGCAKARVEIEFADLTATTRPQAEMSVFCRKTIPKSNGCGYDVDRIVLARVQNTPEHHVSARIKKCDVTIDIGGEECVVPMDRDATAFWYDQDPGLVLNLGHDVHDYLTT